MSYIEREVALQIIDNYAKTVTADGKVVVDAVRDIVGVITPTADVVEVVRCKDCKHYKGEQSNCWLMRTKMQSTDYCSYGERREG